MIIWKLLANKPRIIQTEASPPQYRWWYKNNYRYCCVVISRLVDIESDHGPIINSLSLSWQQDAGARMQQRLKLMIIACRVDAPVQLAQLLPVGCFVAFRSYRAVLFSQTFTLRNCQVRVVRIAYLRDYRCNTEITWSGSKNALYNVGPKHVK